MRAIDPGPLAGTGSGENCNVGGFPTPDFDCGRNPPAFIRSPAQVRFTPDGNQLVVTVKGTNAIYVFAVGKDGKPAGPTVTQAPGPALPTYYGFAFDRKQRMSEQHMIVTEAFGGSTSIPLPGAGAVSSFAITKSGHLNPISASIGDGGTAACWIAIEPITGRYAYISNNLSNFQTPANGQNNSISTYSVGKHGSLTLLEANAAGLLNGPNDLAVVGENGASFLYVLASGTGTVAAFQINLADGSLMSLGAVSGLPPNDGAQGLAAY